MMWGAPDIGEEEIDAVVEVMKSGWVSRGSVTEEFERRLSEYIGAPTLAVNNGTSALLVSYMAAGIRAGDKVIVPDFTYVATASAATMLGARIIPCDVDPDTFNISMEECEKLLEKHRDVKAVVITDVAGQPNDIDYWITLSEEHHFQLIEDAAEALGAVYTSFHVERKIGRFWHPTIFSFQASKPITTMEGGAISCQDNKFMNRCRMIANHGQGGERYVHPEIGFNARITDVQSAMGLVQLKKIDEMRKRREIQCLSYKTWKSLELLSFQKQPDYVKRHAWFMCIGLECDELFAFQQIYRLQKEGIDVRKLWMPIHMQPCYPEWNDTPFPVSTDLYNRGLSLPLSNKGE